MKKILIAAIAIFFLFACKKNNNPGPPSSSAPFLYTTATINDSVYTGAFYHVDTNAVIRLTFSAPVNSSSVAASVSLTSGGATIAATYSYSNSDTVLIIQPQSSLKPLTNYTLTVSNSLKSSADSALKNTVKLNFVTEIDSTDKFPRISDSALLTLVQQQTFNYFWNAANPTSGMVLERISQTQATTGGSGFGVMSMLVGVQRSFITRAQALTRITTIVNFLTNNASTFHGAFSHWLDGTSGATIPFSTQDNGGDIVETSYMIAGLLCARQYFNSTTDAGEISLRVAINNLYNNVQWNWYRQNGQNVLYWNWSPTYNFAINEQVTGWCEALIAYVLGAS